MNRMLTGIFSLINYNFAINIMDLEAPILYNDKDIKIRESGLTIKFYFFYHWYQ